MKRKSINIESQSVAVQNQGIEGTTPSVSIVHQNISITEQPIIKLETRFDPYRSPVCEICSSKDTYVYCTRNKVRYVKCKKCGWTFKN
jgi:hypothetical protein